MMSLLFVDSLSLRGLPAPSVCSGSETPPQSRRPPPAGQWSAAAKTGCQTASTAPPVSGRAPRIPLRALCREANVTTEGPRQNQTNRRQGERVYTGAGANRRQGKRVYRSGSQSQAGREHIPEREPITGRERVYTGVGANHRQGESIYLSGSQSQAGREYRRGAVAPAPGVCSPPSRGWLLPTSAYAPPNLPIFAPGKVLANFQWSFSFNAATKLSNSGLLSMLE
eukprot:1181334-Prorocentrum_minimum.AAC.2